MLEVGVEPTSPRGHRFLRPTRMPFRHSSGIKNGAEGDRTPDLVNAIQALSQLSYSPKNST